MSRSDLKQPPLVIDGRAIGPDAPCYLIAEVGTTCLGELDSALALVDAAAAARMDAVKFQVINPDQVSDRSVTYKMPTADDVEQSNMYDMFSRLTFSLDEWRQIQAACEKASITFFATVDDLSGVDLLRQLDVPAYKIGAWDLTYMPLIQAVARTGKPCLVDLGPTDESELLDAVTWFNNAGGKCFVPLHDFHTDVSSQMNMQAIAYLKEKFGVAGWSSPDLDHDLDIVSLGFGASIIEKRLILDRSAKAYHAHQSLEPQELGEWINRIRRLEQTLGKPAIVPSDSDLQQSKLYYRSICTLTDIRKGDVFDAENLGGKRPGDGIPTVRLPDVWGKRAARDIVMNTLLTDADIA